MTGPTSITVAVLTYRRPLELRACLSAIAAHVTLTREEARARGLALRVLVVDNDPLASARAVVAESPSGSIAVDYVVEQRPGIAAARDRALREAAGSDLLVFLDDDERPTARWLIPLVDTWAATGAAAVAGRVVSVFSGILDPWVIAGSFFRRRRMPTGTPITLGAAGNLLLDLGQVQRLGTRFDDRLSLGAGEDSLFTSELVRAGGRMVWCDESVATDHVPAERTTREWVLARARSHGNTETVVRLRLATSPLRRLMTRVHAAARGSVRVVGGRLRWAVGRASGSLRHQARGLRTAYRGMGITMGAFDSVIQEYARDADDPRTQPEPIGTSRG
jgi:glycosyltransferase involved in cell wall biosynthesis